MLYFFIKVGKDIFGKEYLENLTTLGIDTSTFLIVFAKFYLISAI